MRTTSVPAERRVRHGARDALGVVVFSAVASTTLAGLLVALTMVAGG